MGINNLNTPDFFAGINSNKKAKKYVAQYNLNGRVKHIGYYQTALEASEAYQAKIKVHYGEFANLN